MHAAPTPVVCIGAGGHGRVVAEALRLSGTATLAGWIDADPARHGTLVLDAPVLGGDDTLPGLLSRGIRHAVVGVGSTGPASLRRSLFELLLRHGFTPWEVRHPLAVVSPSADLGRGATLLALSIVAAGARLGDNVILNHGAVADHDCVVGDHAHLAPGARLGGGVTVGGEALVGSGATVLPGLRVGRGAVVGAGAVVVRDVPDGAVVAGIPARPLRGIPS